MAGTEAQLPDRTARILAGLDGLPELIARIEHSIKTAPAAASEAATDLNRPPGPIVPEMAGVLLGVSVDHLRTWHHVIANGMQPMRAHVTLLRGAMEAGVTCRWLIDPSAGSGTRISRAAGLFIADYEFRHQFEESTGQTNAQPPAKRARDRKADLKSALQAAHLKPHEVPGMKQRFRSYAVPNGDLGVGLYNLMSAFAHGQRWADLVQIIRPVAVEGGVDVAAVSADDDLSATLSALALSTLRIAAIQFGAYRGCSPDPDPDLERLGVTRDRLTSGEHLSD